MQWSDSQDLQSTGDLVLRDLTSYSSEISGKREPTGGACRKNRKPGKLAGVRERLRKQPLSRIPMLSVKFSVRCQHEFSDAYLLAITETWLSERDLDMTVVVDGFGAPRSIEALIAHEFQGLQPTRGLVPPLPAVGTRNNTKRRGEHALGSEIPAVTPSFPGLS
ncbi:hypothetical protein XENOCAPTIV_015641 [Xenoophorus captivus]|uniref:Uncharacterized protein n=1 Tax=Xenoophorus captivus TaxID=1517983 RepID=A0ABV0S4P1_9TELE